MIMNLTGRLIPLTQLPLFLCFSVTLQRLIRHDWPRQTSKPRRFPPQLRRQRSPHRCRIFVQLVALLSSRPLPILHPHHLPHHPISPHRSPFPPNHPCICLCAALINCYYYSLKLFSFPFRFLQ